MKTISVIAHKRPEYLKRTLTALSQCRGIEEYEVFVSVDDAANQPPTLQIARSFAATFGHDRFHVWAPTPLNRLGVNYHPLMVYDNLFTPYPASELMGAGAGSDFNVIFEDDVVPSSDALELCEWFYALPERDQYVCLLLHGGTTTQERPRHINEVMVFVPWGWAVTREMWEKWFRPEWNAKKIQPNGWDWSCGLTIQRHGLKVLKPHLSRTLNIGREGGVYETPDHWDHWAKELVASDGTHGKDYHVTGRLQPGYEENRESWVVEEMKADGSL